MFQHPVVLDDDILSKSKFGKFDRDRRRKGLRSLVIFLIAMCPLLAIASTPCSLLGQSNRSTAAAKQDDRSSSSVVRPEFTVVKDGSSERGYHEINEDLRAFMRRESMAKRKEDQVAALLDLCALFEELKQDPRLDESPTLQNYKNKLWSRLNSIESDIKKQMSRQARLEKRSKYQSDPATKEFVDETAAGFSGQISLLGHVYGGPGKVFTLASGAYGGGTVGDYGDDLVRLIQRTISPEFWDVNGGPGSIQYYRPLHALVIRATSEIHHDIGSSLDALRRAGGR